MTVNLLPDGEGCQEPQNICLPREMWTAHLDAYAESLVLCTKLCKTVLDLTGRFRDGNAPDAVSVQAIENDIEQTFLGLDEEHQALWRDRWGPHGDLRKFD